LTFVYYIFSKKSGFLTFEREKLNFTFAPSLEKSFRLPLGNPLLPIPWKKIFPTPMIAVMCFSYQHPLARNPWTKESGWHRLLCRIRSFPARNFSSRKKSMQAWIFASQCASGGGNL